MKILLVGATGQMGRAVSDLAGSEIVAGIGRSASDFPVYETFKEVTEDVDVIIDFSTPDLLEDMLNFAEKNKVPVVIATTGYSEAHVSLIEDISNNVPIVYAGNYSLGINVMEQLAEQIARTLKNFDIEITETHHKFKKDAPSGTANMLFDAVNHGRDGKLHKLEGRSGMYESRDQNEVGISSLRGGTAVGEHSVFFYGEDEIIELKHTAFSKRIFAKGALEAAEFLVQKEPGLYTVTDVLEG